jgi:hypothetical protein
MKLKGISFTGIGLLLVATIVYVLQPRKTPPSTQVLVPSMVVPPPPGKTFEELAKEATKKYLETLHNVNSKYLVEMKVREAAKLIEKEGPTCFNEFRGNSRFISGGTYVWVILTVSNKKDPVWVLVQPIDPNVEKIPLEYGKQDAYKRYFLYTAGDIALNHENNQGWLCYYWPNPGQSKPARKAVFVKLATYHNVRYIVGGGTSDPNIVEEVLADPTSIKIDNEL